MFPHTTHNGFYGLETSVYNNFVAEIAMLLRMPPTFFMTMEISLKLDTA